MRTAWLMPLVCLSIHASDPWREAQAAFNQQLQPGFMGCLVYVERLEGTSLRLRVQTKGLRLGFLEGDPVGQPGYTFTASAPRGTSDLRLVTVVPEGATTLRLKLHADEARTELLVHLPKPGESEGVVVQMEAPQGGVAGASRSK